MLIPLTIPSPGEGVWHLGPLPIRAYALCIIAGIVAAVWVSEKRWQARGGTVGDIQDIALWAVPFGLVGGRLYHVITDHDLYFGEGRHPIDALYVWHGGLGIWGAISLGALGAWIGARRKGFRFTAVMDACAPGVVLAQGIGRLGNYFNQELYGRVTDLPWKLEITKDADGNTVAPTYHHPTFLYELIWDLGVFGLLLWAERRFKLGYGRVFAVYVMAYTLGRGWIENLRVDNVEYDDIAGLRLNVWTSIVVFCLGLILFVWSARRHPGPDVGIYRPGHEPATEAPTPHDTAAGQTAGPAEGQTEGSGEETGEVEDGQGRSGDDVDRSS